MLAKNTERAQLPAFLLLLLLLGLADPSFADAPADIPQQYRSFFRHFVDKRSFTEKMLNAVGLSNEDVGRSFALVAGVARYPKSPSGKVSRDLRLLPADAA
jgi:hypothetical protein